MLELGTLGLGRFDVVLVSGVLYHVDAPDLRPFLVGIREHDDDSTPEEKEHRAWASFENTFSFLVTERSLMNLLRDVGFGMVLEPLQPKCERPWRDRKIVVADARSLPDAHPEPIGMLSPGA